MIEHFFTCPYCWQDISMLLDPDMDNEEYVEDCQVCCNPISIRFTIVEDRVIKFEAIKLQ
jgi:hypothetical protein